MKIKVRLLGTTGRTPLLKFSLSSEDGKNAYHMQTVFEYIMANSTVLGLKFELTGDGQITLIAAASQLTPEIVADVRRVAEAALQQI